MRYIIIDYARQRGAAKRGGSAKHVQLDDNEIAVEDQVQQLLALDEAMQALGRLDERLVRMVECRYFTGMTEQETAEALEISLSTVQRDWKRAKAWLKEEMRNPTK
jgi:RNA polymerase sigma factor (TIGR02999 family)